MRIRLWGAADHEAKYFGKETTEKAGEGVNMVDFGQEINGVFRTLDEKFSLKLTAQVRNSGLHFHKFYQVEDLVTNRHWFHLVIDEDVIRFTDQLQLLTGLHDALFLRFRGLNEEYHSLSANPHVDANWTYMEHERIGQQSAKIWKIIGALRKRLSLPPAVDHLKW